MEGTLYVSDLDGTLLQPDGTLSDESRETLSALLADGLLFTVATARSVTSLREKLGGLELRLPVIEQNGSFISELATGRHLVVNEIEPAVAKAIHEQMQAAGASPFLNTFDGERDHVYHGDVANDCMRLYVDDRRQAADPRFSHGRAPEHGLTQQVVGFTVADREEVCRGLEVDIQAAFAGQVQTHCIEEIYADGWYWLTVHAAKATKGQALEELVDLLGLTGCRCVAFGDQVNDLELMRQASHGVAVGNAVASVQEAADEVIGRNSEHAVARWIKADWERMQESRPG